MSKYEQIKTEIVEDGLFIITLCRPEVMNAFTARMMHELCEAFDSADADDNVRAIIVTGDGDRAFCAGADLSGGGDTFNYEKRQDQAAKKTAVRDDGSIDWSDAGVRDSGGKLSLRIYESVKPVIAAVNGAAVGIGATMQLPMDIRIASENARFGFVFSRRGVVPEACSSWFLPRLVGISQALQWCYTGKVFNADEALRGGLISEITPKGKVLERAKEIAREMTKGTAPISVTISRQMLWRMLGADHPMEAHKVDSKAIYGLGRMPDAKEGVTSFLEKREPEFSDSPARDIPDFYPWWDERKYK
ncbi:MAG: crotonase/enoyl-CoA hydratase family protein [Alphaproteobacteria bacterium]|nr:crotonase/enoyl-CoA hydratase family protein [Alphaproteobacteria bacterium]